MRLIYTISASLFVLAACNTEEPNNTEVVTFNYPETLKKADSAIYFGETVKDPYYWLEDDRSPETENWVQEQNKFTADYLSQIDFKDQLKDRFSELWDYEKFGSPFKKGDNTYYYKNDGLQNQYVVYKIGEDGKDEVFLDPNKFSEDGTVSLSQLSFSEDGKLAAYAISEGGSDWRKVIIIDTESLEQVEDTLIDIKFSGLSWKSNDGFYYSSYDKPEGSELSAKTDQHKLYYHKLGTAQKDDKIIFGDIPSQKRRYVGGSVTEDNRYLFISGSNSTSGNELYMVDLIKNPNKIVPILTDFDSDSYVIENEGTKLYIVTNLHAPNKRIVTVDASNPSPENWVDFIPETNQVLSPSTGGGYFFASYMKDAISVVTQYNYEGHSYGEIDLPGIGTANGFGGEKEDTVIYFSFSNYHTPGSIYTYKPVTKTSALYWSPEIDFDQNDFESTQVFYDSKDGTTIPMIITHKKGLELNGKNPTILYGYGGFNISLTPSFSINNVIWMEQGGVFAVPNIRGGGEYGKAWHDAGTQLKKQNVFDDFIAAAEFLIQEKYTSSDYLAIKGGSNGGLLVGAVMTQRPDLIKVALPAVGVLDMLRYHTFTAGAGWSYDYGTSDQSEEMFKYLLGYSPVHNVKEGVKYPATMVTTGDHDDRVVPAHSFKFIAELQAKQKGPNPVLIRIETDGGHGAGTPVSKVIENSVDQMSFTLYNMGLGLKE
ncbi:prolyl oligopeptidase family serine peptidase [Crocinitomix catalasitica]|uniref:prolyl oligopeptidase family serine peptidase n=1 Tax=Crocinitomix catalasitica TaxID=184607 RepID=UPI00055D6335|nr:prolyl oligopeptidase family serine peptidase [Crocinitomix catalasitica]